MKKVLFNGEIALSCGGSAYVQGAQVIVPEDYTMNQLVTEIKEAGYISFMLPTMKKWSEFDTIQLNRAGQPAHHNMEARRNGKTKGLVC